MFDVEKNILPEFPSTRYLPHNVQSGAKSVSTVQEAAIIFSTPLVYVEEKIDGANSGFCHFMGQPIIRNRNHILRKGYGRKRTAAKMQFAPIWNWYYDNMSLFEKLNRLVGFEASVYGEWMYYQHTIFYDQLPSYFIAYDIYNHHEKYFLDPGRARSSLISSGFNVPLLVQVEIKNYEELDKAIVKSVWSSELIEGLYLKVSDGARIVNRFKMVRPGFVQGVHFGERRNKLAL